MPRVLAIGSVVMGLLSLALLLIDGSALRQRGEGELAALAATDPLTGLANRRMLDKTFSPPVCRCPRSCKLASSLPAIP